MLYTGFFKRIIPFVLTFAAGLFIASFFVSIAAPSFGNWRESRRSRCRDKHDLRLQLDRLREEKRTLEMENEMLKQQMSDSIDFEIPVVPGVPAIEHPPAPPKRPKHPRHEILQ
jgi:hypothetical protein